MYKIYEKLRDEKGVSDYRVAKETGISSSSFPNWKAGRYQPKSDKLKKLADYFGVSIETFLEEQ